MNPPRNRRVLVIDDAPSIHQDFRKILESPPGGADLDETESELFGLAARPHGFEVDSAYQGREGLRMVEAALGQGRPYAMAFVDMRMPPGWDGVETVERIWQADPHLQIVICTAYSDHPWDEVLARLDVQDRLLIVKKPFDMIEVSQLARTLTAKWSLARQAAAQVNALERNVQNLRVTEAALRHSNHELEAFAHSVSHDLRSPLTVMSAFSSLLAAELEDIPGGKARHYLDRIRNSAAVSEQLIEGLLSLTRIARAGMSIERIDLSALARQLLETMVRVAPQRRVEVTIEPGLVACADPLLIQMALKELLENAWKFTGGVEPARIEFGRAPGEDDPAVFYVRDNGNGFDMAYADKLFHTFQRLHPTDQFPGNGIGLVRASRVIARHGGRVWAGSAINQGSTFYFTLPPQAPEQAPALHHRDY
jgi:two-component system, NtrC family, sensor kinase